jgi:hypothetical protein
MQEISDAWCSMTNGKDNKPKRAYGLYELRDYAEGKSYWTGAGVTDGNQPSTLARGSVGEQTDQTVLEEYESRSIFEIAREYA